MNIARDYGNDVDLHLAGWKVIHVWECDIRTKAKREPTLESLYQEIVGTDHKPIAYETSPDDDQIAAEPNAPYGVKKI